MTVTNGHKNPREDAAEQSGADALDELLDSLRTDQDGARTQALKRALGHGASGGGVNAQRVADLEATVADLQRDVTAREVDGTESSEDVRTKLEDVTNELQTLRTTVDELESATDARESAVDDSRDIEALEAALAALERRHATVEKSIGDLRSELAETRQFLDSSGGDPSADQPVQTATNDDVANRVDHLERILDTRTSALASKAKKVEALETRIDELESSVDDRTAALEADLEAVNETLEEAATMLQSETRDELERVQTTLESRLGTLDDEFRSAIESLEDDVDTLEWHAVDMVQWRKTYEDWPGDEENSSDADNT